MTSTRRWATPPQELLVAKDGSLIPWTALNMHDETFACVRQFQFRQDTPGRAILRVVPGAGFCEEQRAQIIKKLERKLEGRLSLSIVLTDTINVTPQGKAIYVDQAITDMPREWDGDEPDMQANAPRAAAPSDGG